MPQGYLRGQKMIDNAHEFPADYVDSLPRDLRKSAIGYVSFPNLTVERPGTYRIRITLLKMADVGYGDETETLLSVDSNAFRVEPSASYAPAYL